GNELARHHATLDGVDELEAFAGFLRLDLEHHVAVLALAARLANKLALDVFYRLADGFTVGHLRLAHVGFHAEFALHSVDDDLQVQLAHAGDDGLAGLLVGLDAKGRVLGRQALQREAHLLLVGLGLGLHGLRDHRLGEHHALEHDDGFGIAQGLARGHVFQAHAGGDVAGTDLFHFLAVVRVHLHDTPDALLLA